MTMLFFVAFILLILAELIKGLNANGTPPVLQRYSWQIDLAHTMWTQIRTIRIVLISALILFTLLSWSNIGPGLLVAAVFLGLTWWGVFWVFNRFWVGKFKFLPITQKLFLSADSNQIDDDIQVLGVDQGGQQKAFPVNMLFYHHQITDEIAGRPIWVTYCGLCRSGRVYDILVDGGPMEFSLVGAITYNAVFQDVRTGSWWRQETGEAAKGPLKGRQLEDLPFEQMSLKNWIAKHPQTQILQYDPTFEKKYNFTAALLKYEVSLPGWHMQSTPPLICGLDINGEVRGYDWEQLLKQSLVMDELGGIPILLLADSSGDSVFAYDRIANGSTLEFEYVDGELKDIQTGSTWDMFGRCNTGAFSGTELSKVQSYKQFVRAWISFHPGTTFYSF